MKKEDKKFYKKVIITILGVILSGEFISLSINNSRSKTIGTIIGINADENSNQRISNNNINGAVNYGTVNGDININSFDYLNEASVEIYELNPTQIVNHENTMQYCFFKQQENYSNPNKIYYFDKDCINMIAISNNNLNKEIVLRNFKFVAENIMVDTMPHLSSFCTRDDDYNRKYLFDMYLRNNGWGDANNVELTIEDENGILNLLFEKDDLRLFLPSVEYGNITNLKCVNLEKIDIDAYNSLIDVYGEFNIHIAVYANSDECDFGAIGYIELHCCADSIEDMGGYGYGGDTAYAIIIDTDNDSFVLDVNVSECIPAGSILELPLCFFPDRSCTFSYYVMFEVFDGFESYTIKTEGQDIEFVVDSCCDVNVKDISNMSNQEQYFFITYPYAILRRLEENEEYYELYPKLQ